MARKPARAKSPSAKARAKRPGKGQAAAKRGTARQTKTRTIKAPAAKRQQPIELHYWPTPNGWKISIMLEECRLPYIMKPVNISTGDQFKPEFLAISPNNRMPAIV
ncbi:MAG: hypothetical protein AB7F49_24710, partial [Pseudorhodoplanes sp.]